MNAFRIISKIDIKDNSIVKGINLEGLRKLGDPYDFARYYYKNGIDEIILHDVTASLYGNNCLTDVISKICKDIFIPIIVGGGIRTLKDIEKIMRSGGDRVLLNSAVVKNLNFLKNASKNFGSSNIAVNIEYSFQKNKNLIFYEYGRQITNIELYGWCKKIEDYGAGEIILTSIDNEGTGNGFDLAILKDITKFIKVPITVHGGFHKIDQIIEVSKLSEKITGVALSSMLHYNYLKLKKTNNFQISKKIEKCNIKEIKKKLLKEKILVR